jgi:hypothetical protein
VVALLAPGSVVAIVNTTLAVVLGLVALGLVSERAREDKPTEPTSPSAQEPAGQGPGV